MPALSLDGFKRYLRVTHAADDLLLADLLADAEDECLQFLDRKQLPHIGETAVDECDSNDPSPVSDSDDLARSVRSAAFLIAQAMYERKDENALGIVRKAAEVKLMPYRNNLGT